MDLSKLFWSVSLVLIVASTACKKQEAQQSEPTPSSPFLGSTAQTLAAPPAVRGSRQSSAEDRLSALGATLETRLQGDFGGLYSAEHPHWVLEASSAELVQGAVVLAAELSMGIRARGRGHSMDGSAMGRHDELLLDMRFMRELCRLDEQTVRVGAGAGVAHLNSYLLSHGLRLPVFNDGGAGPSLGGYMAAGGFGEDAETNGPFWANVRAFEFVDGLGNLRRLERGDEHYSWFFGSNGQLGVVTTFELPVLQAEEPPARSRPLELGSCVELPKDGDIVELPEPLPPEARLFWWTVFVPASDVDKTRRELEAIVDELTPAIDNFEFLHVYYYVFDYDGSKAPLVTGLDEPTAAVGVWGHPAPGATVQAALPSIQRADVTIDAWAAAGGHRRYLPAELAVDSSVARRNLGDETFETFRDLKRLYDPDSILGRGYFDD